MQIDPAERHANMIITMWDLKTNKQKEPTKQNRNRLTDAREQTSASQSEGS